jgi:hypothetical protein
MPDVDGMDLLQAAVGLRPDVPVIVITAFGSIASAIAAIRTADYLSEPFEIEDLLAVQRALEDARLRRDLESRRTLAACLGVEGFDVASGFRGHGERRRLGPRRRLRIGSLGRAGRLPAETDRAGSCSCEHVGRLPPFMGTSSIEPDEARMLLV